MLVYYKYVRNFSLVRNNPERQVGNFDTMLYGWTSLPNQMKHGYKSASRSLAQLVDVKYGKVIDAPEILVR